MERNTIIATIGAVVGVVGLIFAVTTNNKVKTINNSLDFDRSMNVAIASPESESGAYNLDTENMTQEEIDKAMAEIQTAESTANSTTGEMNVILDGNVLKLVDSTVRVPMINGNDTSEDLYIFLSGANRVRYDSTTDYLVVNGRTIVRTINAVDATYNGISQFTGVNGETILIGERKVNDRSAIVVIHTVEQEENGKASDQDIAIVQEILNSAKSNVKLTAITLFGTRVNPDWTENIVMTGNALELIKGTSRIYIAPYEGSFAEGTTNTLVSGSTTFTYSDNIKDQQSGYTPYIYTFSQDQGGKLPASASTNSMLQVKVVAQSNMIIKDLYN